MIVEHVNCGHQILATFQAGVGTAAAVRYGLTQHEDFYQAILVTGNPKLN